MMRSIFFYKFFYYYMVIFSAYVTGDFLMGLFHWFKDTYFTPFTPIIGKKLIWSSRLHHIKPRYVIEFSNKDLIIGSAKYALIWMAPIILYTRFNLFWTILFLTISVNDVIHKYAHIRDHERPFLATILQKLYITQSYDEHHQHHISPHEINYCPITPYLNPTLEKVNFWRKLEYIVEKTTGTKPRATIDKYIEDNNYPAGIKFIKLE